MTDDTVRPWWRHPAAVIGLAWLAGSVPSAQLVSRARTGIDLRTQGNGTVSGSALVAVAGKGATVVAGLADVAKGTVGPLLAGPDRPLLAAIAGGAGVAGHNWSVFLGGSGGRGVSPSMGVLLVRNWPGTVALLSGWAGFRVIDQAGLGCFAADVALLPALARTRGRDGAMAGAGVLVPMIAKRLAGNRPPERRTASTYLARLVLDRDGWR